MGEHSMIVITMLISVMFPKLMQFHYGKDACWLGSVQLSTTYFIVNSIFSNIIFNVIFVKGLYKVHL